MVIFYILNGLGPVGDVGQIFEQRKIKINKGGGKRKEDS